MEATAMVFMILGFSCILRGTYGLYEDQTGLFDWRQQYVGAAKHVVFDQCAQSVCKSIIVATDENVLAALSMRDGEIVWRQILEKSDSGRIDDMLLVDGKLIIINGGGSYIRSFTPGMGVLNWEYSVESADTENTAKLVYSEFEDDQTLVVLAGSTLRGMSTRGMLKWEQVLPHGTSVTYQYMRSSDEIVQVVGLTTGSHIVLVNMKLDGTQVSQHTVSAAWITQQTGCQFTGNLFVCIDGSNGILHQLSLDQPDVFKSSLLQDVGISCSSPVLLDSFSTTPQGELAVACPSGVTVISLSDTGASLIKDLPEVKTAQVIKYGEHRAFITLARSKSDACKLRCFDLKSGQEFPEMSQDIAIFNHHGDPVKIFGLVKKKESGPVFRILTLSQDDSIMLFGQSGKLTWVREEALTKVASVEMVDLPVSPILAKMEEEFGTNSGDILGMFVRRFKTQFSQLQAFLHKLKNRLQTHKHHHHVDEEFYDEDDEDDDFLYRDDFNLKKIIILASEVGKIYGMYSSTGRILWRHFIPGLQPFEAAGKTTMPIFMQRTTAHFPHDPEVIIIGKDKKSGHGLLYRFHPVSGHPLDESLPHGEVLDYNIKQILMLQHMDEQFLHPLIVLDSNLQYHVYPKSSTNLVKSIAPSLYMLVTSPDSAHVKGYSMAMDDNQGLVAEPVWEVNLSGEVQSITNVVSKRAVEHVHSQGIVLADRSVLYKYLNPNLVVITAEGQDNSQKSFLNVYLIDAVSGQLIFHCNHKKSKGPVHIVHSENWILYDYWNQRHRRSEISVLELYEGKKQSNATVFSSLFPPPLPMVLRQSYIFSQRVNAMSVTITEKGITNKHVIFAMENGGILEMPKALLDPRRPEVPTQEHREEGIIPYIPELPRQSEAILNYNHSVYRARGIHTAPAGLESHSMVLCYGLDFFYTRALPSKMFDVLKEDFDYLFIGSVTFGMILVSIVTKSLAARKALNRVWK